MARKEITIRAEKNTNALRKKSHPVVIKACPWPNNWTSWMLSTAEATVLRDDLNALIESSEPEETDADRYWRECGREIWESAEEVSTIGGVVKKIELVWPYRTRRVSLFVHLRNIDRHPDESLIDANVTGFAFDTHKTPEHIHMHSVARSEKEIMYELSQL